MKPAALLFSTASLLALGACDGPPAETEPQPTPEPAVEESTEEVDLRWLPDGDGQRFAALEDQLGGFSEAMRHVNYRYMELYWAGEDRNWEYAAYQLDKLSGAIELGIIRRPGRAESSRPFLDSTVPALQEAIDEGDGEKFDERFEEFTLHCNTCHGQEDVAFIEIAPPEYRATSLAPLSQ